MVSNCRYPPAGHRSVTGRLPQVDFEDHPQDEVTRSVNNATLVVVMVETPTAVENVEAIAAVPGVDSVLVGTNDLCTEMGIPGAVGDARIQEIMERVVAACRAHGKHPGLGGVYEPAPHGSVHPDGDAAHPLRQRSHDDDGGRPGAKRPHALDFALAARFGAYTDNLTAFAAAPCCRITPSANPTYDGPSVSGRSD